MIDPGLDGQVALVTGANNPLGIGAAIARNLARQGCAICVHYWRLRPEEHGIPQAEALGADKPGAAYYHGLRMRSGDEVADALWAEGARAVALEADLTREAAIAGLLDAVEDALGPVSILVNNAASYGEEDTVLMATGAIWDASLGVNIRGAALLTREVARRLRDRGDRWGRVVNLSTDAAQCFATQVAYGASKAALESFTRTAAVELGPLGITVNAVAPGPVQSGWLDVDAVAEQSAQIPLGRVGTPQDIADAVLFLCSRQSDWLTGNVIKVSGGHAL